MALVVRYVLLGARTQAGSGRTVNVSSRGLLMTADHELLPGTSVKLSVAWPVDLNPSCSLALHVGGRVVRNEGRQIAIRFSTRELRTRPPRFAGQGHGVLTV